MGLGKGPSRGEAPAPAQRVSGRPNKPLLCPTVRVGRPRDQPSPSDTPQLPPPPTPDITLSCWSQLLSQRHLTWPSHHHFFPTSLHL